MSKIQVKAYLSADQLSCTLVTQVLTTSQNDFSPRHPASIAGTTNPYVYAECIVHAGIRIFLAMHSTKPRGGYYEGYHKDFNGPFRVLYLPRQGNSLVVPAEMWPTIKELVKSYNEFYKE